MSFSRQLSKQLIFDFIGLVSVLEAQGAVPFSLVRSHAYWEPPLSSMPQAPACVFDEAPPLPFLS